MAAITLEEEHALRQEIFDILNELARRNGDFVTRDELLDLHTSDGETHKIIDPGSRGIRNPTYLHATLSVLSTPKGPYRDREIQGGLFHYSYRANTVDGDNRKLRRAYELGLPIILLRWVSSNTYVPICPVYVMHDDKEAREFVLTLDNDLRFISDPQEPSQAERQYADQVVKRRLHQREFRARIIRAYGGRCAVCSLDLVRLIDAAHIIPDGEPLGEPVVENGLSLCTMHHAAYDRQYLGISPQYKVKIHPELQSKIDGPMLLHGLQEMHDRTLALPRNAADQPDSRRLDIRFHQFLQSDSVLDDD